MRTKHLIVALLLIVAIFVTRGFYVVQEVNDSTETSYHEFELITTEIAPLKNIYVAVMASSQIKAADGLITSSQFLEIMNAAEAEETMLLENYAEDVRGKETVSDRELFTETLQIHSYVDRMQQLAREGNVEAIHATVYSGEMSSVYLSAYKTLNKISTAKLKTAEECKLRVKQTIHNFETVLKFSGTLIMILGVLVVKYKESTHRSATRAPFAVSKKK